MRRFKHSLSHYKLATLDMGELVPVSCVEVLPGDTLQQASSALIRVSPLVAPVMHPVTVRLHHWFVPNRLVWEDWESFITGGPDGMDASVFPTIASGAGFAAGGLADYFGVPPAIAGVEVSALPFRAYNLIFNEYYRDQDLVTALTVPVASGTDSTSPVAVQKIAWEKDYFTSARPWPQKGPDITLPLGDRADVKGLAVATPTAYTNTAAGFRESGTVGDPAGSNWSGAGPSMKVRGDDATDVPDLYADLSSATAVNVNDVRRAFALQRYEEARAAYGSRYTEYLRYLGVRSSDARLQRPEYLGGGKQTIAFTEVLQTGPDTSDEGVANLKGHGIAAMRSRRYRRFFEEHGMVITLMSVRPRSMYVNGLKRMFNRRTKEDFWQKELEMIGQQEIQNQEVFVTGTDVTDQGTFGYQDRYAEYRHEPSLVAGDFRDTFDYWHLARIFGSAPTLNSDFVTCDPTKRVFAVQTEDVLWCMVNHSIQARRMVGNTAIGRII